jgi:bacterioferritin
MIQSGGAIQLYRQIINVAENEHDDVTKNLFQQILSDEEKHHRVFSNLLGED